MTTEALEILKDIRELDEPVQREMAHGILTGLGDEPILPVARSKARISAETP